MTNQRPPQRTTIPRRTLLKMLGINAGALTVGQYSLLNTAFAAPQPTLPSVATGKTNTLSDKIADYITTARFEDLPPEVVSKAKEQIVFFFARAFEGLFDHKAAQLRAIARQIEQSAGGATFIGERFRLLPSDAAFANCTLMRGSYRDDVIYPAGLHAGVVTLPTALAIGEMQRVSGRELLLALVLGYEVLGKLGRVRDGWLAPFPRRPTIIFGAYGPVTVAGQLLKLDQQRMGNALGYAANLGIGLTEGGMTEHYYSLVNRNGIFAAQLAQAGGAAYYNTTIEGELGLYRSFFGEVPVGLERSINNLGSDWEILTAEQKHFSGTGDNAVTLELLLDLKKSQELNAHNVTGIEVVLTPYLGVRDEFTFKGPFKGPGDAYSSLPYAVAIVMVDGDHTLERYADDADDSIINDRAVAAMMQKVNVTFEEGHESERYCRLEVNTTRGEKLVREADGITLSVPRGEWGEWLGEYGGRVLADAQLKHLEELIDDLENLDDVSRLMATVVPPVLESGIAVPAVATAVPRPAAPAAKTRQARTVTGRIADFINGARFEDLPADVINKAKALIIHHFGLAFAGSFNEEATQMRELVRQIDQPGRGATVIGERFRLFPSDAAFANTTLMRAIWRDDVIFPSGIHAGVLTLPTALAIGEVRHVTGKELLLSMVLGYEVMGKLSRVADGWQAPMPRRSSMIYGAFGPVTVGGRLLQLGQQPMTNALGYAANLCMGVNEGGQTDHFYSLISRNATFAAQLAEVGAVPFSETSIEGEFGLYNAFFGEVPPSLENMIDNLGSGWEILTAEYKRHHGTGQNIIAIELLLSMIKEHKLTADQVQKIDVFYSSKVDGRKTVKLQGPFSYWGDAYASTPYALALVLIDGKVGAERYTDMAIEDKAVNSLTQKIFVAFEDGHEDSQYCRLEIYVADGRKVVDESDQFMFTFPRSDWGPWLQEYGDKLLPVEQLKQLEQMVGDLENLDDISRLLATVVPRQGTS